MADPTGGLARRAGYANNYQSQQRHPILQVDAGNYFKPAGPGSDLINALMAQSLIDFPMQVLNLTAGDLDYWSRHLATRSDLPTHFVSTNLEPLAEGSPAPEAFAFIRLEAGQSGLGLPLRIAFLGLALPQRIRSNSGYRALDPVEAIERVKAQFLAESQLQILLTDLEPKEIERVLTAHPEIDVVVRGERRFVLEKPETFQQTILATAVERGRSLGQLKLELASDGSLAKTTLELIEMGSGIPSDPVLAARETELLEKLP